MTSQRCVFPSYRALKRKLGEFDAVVECNELAMRELIQSLRENPAYVEDLSAKHGIKVDSVNLDILQPRVAQFYILSVYQQFEGFLESFRDEHPHSSRWIYEDGKSLLQNILRNLDNGGNDLKAKCIVEYQLDILDYYRLVRNHFMHPEISLSKLSSKLNKLRKDQIKEIYPFVHTAPNSFEELSFDDFILFSKVVKEVAWCICIQGRPSNEDLADIIMGFDRGKKYGIRLKRLKQLLTKPARYENALKGVAKSLFGLEDEDATEVAKILMVKMLSAE